MYFNIVWSGICFIKCSQQCMPNKGYYLLLGCTECITCIFWVCLFAKKIETIISLYAFYFNIEWLGICFIKSLQRVMQR